MTLDEPLIAEWIAWLNDLRPDLEFTHFHGEMWREVTDAMWERAPETPGVWRAHYLRLYVDGAAMAVRRLLRTGGSGTITLGKILEGISNHPELFTTDRYLERWEGRNGPDQLERARIEFDRDWTDGQGCLDLRRVRRDRQQMNEIADRVVQFADESLAHTIPGRPMVEGLTFGNLNKAIDHVTETFQQYAAMLTGNWYALVPIVTPEWKSSFYRPLFDAPEWWPLEPDEPPRPS